MSRCCRPTLPLFNCLYGGFAPSGLGAFEGYFAEPTLFAPGDLLFELDLTAPVNQPYPQTSAEVTALGLPAPTSIWDWREAAGNVLDHVGANNLIPTLTPLQNQPANGLWSGTDLHSLRCGEVLDAATARFNAANNTVFDLDAATSFALLLVWRPGSVFYPAANRALVGKRSTVAPNEGWELYVSATGLVTLASDDGVGTATSWAPGTDVRDGAWHCALVVIDRNTGNQTIMTDLGIDTDPLPAGSLTNTQIFSFGRNRLAPIHAQYAYAVAWLGAGAEAIGANVAAAFNAFWTYGAEPTGLLATATHASALCCPVGDDGGGQGEIINDYAVDQFPIGYNATFSHTSKLGARCQPTRSTLLSESDRFNVAPWTTTNVAVSVATADLNNSPRGMREAPQVAATANNGYLEHLFATVAGTLYTMYVYVKRDDSMGGNVTGRLIMWDNTGAAETASQVFTATDEWQLVVLRATTNVGQISTGMRIEIDVNGEALSVFRATAAQNERTAPIFARGGVATIQNTDHQTAVAYRTQRGECEVTYVCDTNTSPANRRVFELRGAVGNNNARVSNVPASLRNAYLLYNATGGVVANFNTALAVTQNTEVVHRFIWRTDAPIAGGVYYRQRNNGVADDDAAGATTSTEPGVTCHVGQQSTVVAQLDGFLSLLRIFNDAQAI